MNASSHGAARLNEGLRDLLAVWNSSSSKWYDDARHRFEQNHMEPIQEQVRMAIVAMEDLGRVLDQVERECR